MRWPCEKRGGPLWRTYALAWLARELIPAGQQTPPGLFRSQRDTACKQHCLVLCGYRDVAPVRDLVVGDNKPWPWLGDGAEPAALWRVVVFVR